MEKLPYYELPYFEYPLNLINFVENFKTYKYRFEEEFFARRQHSSVVMLESPHTFVYPLRQICDRYFHNSLKIITYRSEIEHIPCLSHQE